MEIREILLAVFWLAFAPFAGNETALPEDANHARVIDRMHHSMHDLREAGLSSWVVDWEHSRAFAADMFCDLGVIALALVDCPDWAAFDAAPFPETLILEPRDGNAAPGSSDVRRRSIEERMRSI